MHHHIETTNKRLNSFFRYQSAQSFKKQMQMLVYDTARRGLDVDYKITLDDGLKSQLATVRILKELNLKGCFYYNSQNLTGDKIANVHLVHVLLRLLSADQKQSLLIDLKKTEHSDFDVKQAQYIYRKQGHFSIDQKIKFLVNYVNVSSEVDEILEFHYNNVSTHPLSGLNRLIYMDKDDLRELQRLGHKVLPHGHTHKILGRMSESKLDKEFACMFEVHEQVFKSGFDEICVPYGSIYSWSYECEKVAKLYGVRKIILVDDVDVVVKQHDRALEYFSRTDCCLIENYEYV